MTVEENKESKQGVEGMSSTQKNDANETNNVYESILREKEEKYKGDMLSSFNNKQDIAETSVKATKTEGDDNDNLSKDN